MRISGRSRGFHVALGLLSIPLVLTWSRSVADDTSTLYNIRQIGFLNYSSIIPIAINQKGRIVSYGDLPGYALDANVFGKFQAFAYDDERNFPLPGLSAAYQESKAFGINSKGDIVG